MPLGITRTSRAPSARASAASAFEAQMTIRARRRIGRNSHGSRFASSTSLPHSCTTSGLRVARPANPDGSQCACTTSASRAARRAARANESKNSGSRSTRHFCGAEVVGDPVAVGDPEVAKRLRGDDGHLDTCLAQMLDRVRDEPPGEVTRLARIRRRQDADLHVAESRRPNTAGATIASIAKTKK